MFRFPYRPASLGPAIAADSPPRNLWSRLARAITGSRASPRSDPIVTHSVLRPIVPIRVRGPIAARRLKSALLDTGSQDTLFPLALAEPLGINLAGTGSLIRWRGTEYGVEFQEVELELSQGEVIWRWRSRVGFTAAPLSYALLGYHGCLEVVDAKFFGAEQVVELETNRQFPGVIVAPR